MSQRVMPLAYSKEQLTKQTSYTKMSTKVTDFISFFKKNNVIEVISSYIKFQIFLHNKSLDRNRQFCRKRQRGKEKQQTTFGKILFLRCN